MFIDLNHIYLLDHIYMLECISPFLSAGVTLINDTVELCEGF